MEHKCNEMQCPSEGKKVFLFFCLLSPAQWMAQKCCSFFSLREPSFVLMICTSQKLKKGNLTVPSAQRPYAFHLFLIPILTFHLFLEDLQWQSWLRWSPCSVTCGPGTRKRQRACFPPRNGGKDCPAPGDPMYSQHGECHEQPCAGAAIV